MRRKGRKIEGRVTIPSGRGYVEIRLQEPIGRHIRIIPMSDIEEVFLSVDGFCDYIYLRDRDYRKKQPTRNE